MLFVMVECGRGDWSIENGEQTGEIINKCITCTVNFLSLSPPLFHRPPLLDIQVPQYELPLPEGIGDEKIQVENKSLREIENTWRERLHEAQARNPNR